MSNLENLKKQFFLDEDALKARLEPILEEALKSCRIDKNGAVLITTDGLSGKDRVQLALAARAIAAELEPTISAEVTASELGKFAGLPPNQVRARAKDAVKDKFAVSTKAGSYKALPHKIEKFLASISTKSGA